MPHIAISVKNLTKEYHLGIINHGTLFKDIQSRWARLRGKDDPNSLLSSPNPQSPSRFLALDNVSFDVKQGDVVGIIGRNGAGKSTLLKIISQVTCPTSGVVKLNGRVASLLEVGTGFHPELTGRENVFLNGAILSMSKAEIRAKFDEIVAFAEIEKFIDTPVKRYSSGMYVRLAFGVAAHLDPEILIIDEVLAVGDAQFQKKCLGKMQDVGKEGRTVLFVSHNMVAVRNLCNRVILMQEGRISLNEVPDAAINSYLNDAKDQICYKEWHADSAAPRNSSAVLLRIAACDSSGQLLQLITTDSDIRIEIDFKVTNPGTTVGLALIFYDADNLCIFSSINNGEPNWYGTAMPGGVYRSICVIPGRLLNNRLFSVTLNFFGKSFNDVVTIKDALRLEIMDGPQVRRDFMGECGGYFRPELAWTTRPL